MMKKMKNLSIQKKASFWYLVSNILQKASGFLIIPLYTRVLTIEDYGIYTITDSWMEMLLVITSLNLFQNTFNVAINKFKDKAGVSSAFCGLSIFVTLIAMLIILIFRKSFIQLLSANNSILFAYFIYLISSPIVMIWYAMKRYYYEYVGLIICTLIKCVLFVILGVSVIFVDNNQIFVAIYAKVISELAVALILFVDIVKKNCHLFNLTYWKFAIHMALPLIPYYLSLRILQHLDRIMIGKIVGKQAAAKYGVMYKVSSVIMMVNSSLNGAYIPWLYANIENKKNEQIRRTYSVLVSMILSMNLIISLFAPEIVMVLGTEEYWDAIYVMTPLSLSAVFIFIYDQFVNVELFFEKNRMNAIFAIISSCINAVLNWVFISKYGYIAAGYTTLISYLCFMLMHKIYMKNIKKNFNCEEIFSNRFILFMIIICLVLSVTIPIFYCFKIIRYILVCIAILLLIVCLRHK